MSPPRRSRRRREAAAFGIGSAPLGGQSRDARCAWGAETREGFQNLGLASRGCAGLSLGASADGSLFRLPRVLGDAAVAGRKAPRDSKFSAGLDEVFQSERIRVIR